MKDEKRKGEKMNKENETGKENETIEVKEPTPVRGIWVDRFGCVCEGPSYE